LIFGYCHQYHWNRSGLLISRSTHSHPSILEKSSARAGTHNPKTDLVVPVARIVVVAISRTAILRVVVPRTTPQHTGLPIPSSLSSKN